MLTITIQEKEMYDEEANKIYVLPAVSFDLEHSLVSLSKWESYWEKPFLGKEKTDQETLSYIEFMTISPDVDPQVYSRLTSEHLEEIQRYIQKKMTATWFSETGQKPESKEIITAEIIYYWMLSYEIPFECENWHLNKLLALIKVCTAKNEKPKKRSTAEIVEERRRLNAQRRAAENSAG